MRSGKSCNPEKSEINRCKISPVVTHASLSERLRYESSGESPIAVTAAWAAESGFDEERTAALVKLALAALKRVNLRQYGQFVRTAWRYQKGSFRTDRSKTDRELHFFDCIEAPCVDECPVSQDVPAYMRAVRDGDFDKAVQSHRLAVADVVNAIGSTAAARIRRIASPVLRTAVYRWLSCRIP